MKDKDIKHLEWVYERMKYAHNENENYDYMIRFREILEALRQPLVISSVCTCTKFRETPMINGKHICSICNKPIVQTDR